MVVSDNWEMGNKEVSSVLPQLTALRGFQAAAQEGNPGGT